MICQPQRTRLTLTWEMSPPFVFLTIRRMKSCALFFDISKSRIKSRRTSLVNAVSGRSTVAGNRSARTSCDTSVGRSRQWH